MKTLLGCGKPLPLTAVLHSSAVSSKPVHKKLATGRINRDEKSARAANASINILDGIHRSRLQSNTSTRVSFSAMSVRPGSIKEWKPFLILFLLDITREKDVQQNVFHGLLHSKLR